jgi:glycosyltransferase involved in cell wall biosynthesis
MIKKKNIRIVIDASRNRSGGAIAYLKNFLKHLNLKNTNVKEVIIFSHKNLLKEIPNRFFLTKCTHYLLEKNILFQIIWQLVFLPIYLKKNKIDILYSTDSTTFCRYKKSIIFNQDILSFDKLALNQISFSIEKIRLYVIRFLQIRAMNNANEIIFLSKFSKNVISKNLKNKINSSIIYHGIEERINRLGKKKFNHSSWANITKKKIKLVYVSPLFHYKNHLTVAKAYSRLLKKYSNLDIKFIGNYKNNLNLYHNIISQNSSINKKHFLGELNHKEVIKILCKSDIFVFASSSETFGISLVEAMAIGIPIVCSNKSSLPEILKNGGLYFNPKNDLQLSNQIESFIKNKDLRKIKSKEAKKISLKYSWKENVWQFCKLINKMSN